MGRRSQNHTRIIELLVSLWFRRSYDRVLQRDTNVGTGTLDGERPLTSKHSQARRACRVVSPLETSPPEGIVYLRQVAPARAGENFGRSASATTADGHSRGRCSSLQPAFRC